MNYAAMGACPTPGYGYGGYPGIGFAPFGSDLNSFHIVGAAPPPHAMVGAGYAQPLADVGAGYAPSYAQVGRDAAIGASYDAVGQAAEGTSWFSQPGPLNISRLNWLLGAAAIGATWWAYSRGWLGGAPARRAMDFDFDFGGGDFFF